MKVLLIHNYYRFRGGEETYLQSLHDLLKKKGHTVILYTRDSSKIKDNLLSKIRISISFFINSQVVKDILSLIEIEKPDIVHVHNIYPLITPVVYRAVRRKNIPIIQTVHNYRFICPGGFIYINGERCIHMRRNDRFINKLFHKCYRSSYTQSFIITLGIYYHQLIKSFEKINTYIFPAKFTSNLYQRYLKLSPKKVSVLPYFISHEEKINNNEKKEFDFIFVGRLSQEKGVIELLEVIKTLPYVSLLVVGDGPLREKVNEYNLFKNITIKKFQDKKDVLRNICRAYCLIIPSKWYEVLPNVMLESFSCGVPVLAPHIGEFKNILKNSDIGFTYKFNSNKDLRKRIILVSKNKKRLLSMKSKIMSYYSDNYTEHVHYKGLMKIYNDAIYNK